MVEDECVYCDNKEGLEWHHILPKSLGGPDEPFNLIRVCNVHHALLHGMTSRGNISMLTSLGLQRAKERGVVLGNKTNLKTCGAKGARATKEVAKRFAMNLINNVLYLQQTGCSLRKIATIFNIFEIKTMRGGRWTAQSIHNLIKQADVITK